VTAFIFTLTLRQLISRKSTLLLAGLNALPLLLAVVFSLSNPETDEERWWAILMVNLVVTTILPLTTLLLGTSVLGEELEDGTATYLLTKPIQRWQILVPKLFGAWIVSVALLLPSTVISGLIALDGDNGSGLVTGFAVAIVVGAFAYTTVSVLLSVRTERALIAGLVYVFIWEGAITSIFAGTRYLSIRHYTLGIAGAIADVSTSVFNPYVNGTTAAVLLTLVTALAGYYALHLLQRIEVREQS
jgi:ABC-2 type transport system permease protein